MSGVTFADILFILLTSVVIFVILWLVNRGKNKPATDDGSAAAAGRKEKLSETTEDH